MDDLSRAHSPLAGFAEQLAAAGEVPARIRLTEVPFLAQFTLRVAPGTEAAQAASRTLGVALPTTPNTTCTNGDVELIWMGPDEWLVVARSDGEPVRKALEDALEGEHASLVDVSGQRTVIEVAGADARDVLLKGCALDLHPRAFGVGQCAQTLLARAQVVLLARSEEPAFWVFVRASFAEYLAEWMLDASAEYRGATPLDLSLGIAHWSTRVAA
jgi:sarcosine oxidase subunit gamma